MSMLRLFGFEEVTLPELTGIQLQRAAKAYGSMPYASYADRIDALEKIARDEGLSPTIDVARELELRISALDDVQNGPGVHEEDVPHVLEAIAKVRLDVPADGVAFMGETGPAFDYDHFEELFKASSGYSWFDRPPIVWRQSED